MKVVIHTFGSEGDFWPYCNLSSGLKAEGLDVLLCGPRRFIHIARNLGIPYKVTPPEIPTSLPKEALDPCTANLFLKEYIASNSQYTQMSFSGVIRKEDIYVYSAMTPGGSAYADYVGAQSVLMCHSPPSFLDSSELFEKQKSEHRSALPKFIFLTYPKDFCAPNKGIDFPIVQSCYPFREEPINLSKRKTGVAATLGSIVQDPGNFFSSFNSAAQRLGEDFFRSAQAMDGMPTVIHHGGIGSTLRWLSSGKNQVIVPFMWDQPNNARLASHWGACVLPIGSVTEETAYQALLKSKKGTNILPRGSIKSCARDFIIGVSNHF